MAVNSDLDASYRSALMVAVDALKICAEELEWVRCHCRDARGTNVISALATAKQAIEQGESGQPRIRESGAISVAGGSPGESLTVPTQIAGREATQREVVSDKPA